MVKPSSSHFWAQLAAIVQQSVLGCHLRLYVEDSYGKVIFLVHILLCGAPTYLWFGWRTHFTEVFLVPQITEDDHGRETDI